MTRKLLVVAAGVVGVVLVGAGVAAGLLWQRLHEPYRGYEDAERFVIVAPGSGTVAIGRQLIEAGVVEDETVFRVALWWTESARRLQAGEYRFADPAAPIDVVARLVRGDVHRRPITFPEGLTIAEMAELFELRGFGSFRLRRREPRTGRNPKTGDRVDVPPKKVPYFKPGKELKELINREETPDAEAAGAGNLPGPLSQA